MLEEAGPAAAVVIDGKAALGPRLIAAYNAQVSAAHLGAAPVCALPQIRPGREDPNCRIGTLWRMSMFR